MEVIRSSEMSVNFYRIVWRYVPEDTSFIYIVKKNLLRLLNEYEMED
jgi:hypothetical protein